MSFGLFRWRNAHHQYARMVSFSKWRMKCHYEVLGVPRGATKEEIKKCYLKKVRLYHPDTNPNDKALHAKFLEIDQAYHALVDDGPKRTGFDPGPNNTTYKYYRDKAQSERGYENPPPPDGDYLERQLIPFLVIYGFCCAIGFVLFDKYPYHHLYPVDKRTDNSFIRVRKKKKDS